MNHAPQGERYAHIASHIDGVVFDSTPIQNRAINGANAMAAVPGVPSLLWPLWWGALALWWHVLAGYCYPPGYRDVSQRAGSRSVVSAPLRLFVSVVSWQTPRV